MDAGDSKKVPQIDKLNHRINQILAVLWVILGFVVLGQSRKLKYMDQYGPGPGFLPFWLGVGFIILGLVLMGQFTFRPPKGVAFSPPSKHAAWQMFLVMFGFFAFVFIGEKVGFLLSVGLLFLFLLIVVERKGWKFSLVISIINTLVFWTIFELGLQLRLPPGLLDLLR